MTFPRRSKIYLVDFDPARGARSYIRLLKKLGRLDQATLSLVEDALKISLGLTSAGTFTS